MIGEISILHSKALMEFAFLFSYAHVQSVIIIFGGKASSEATTLTCGDIKIRKAFLVLLDKTSKPVKRSANSRKHAVSKLTARLTQWTEREMDLPRSQIPPNDEIKM
jgi:hypothetical protein